MSAASGPRTRLLIVDDEVSIRFGLKAFFTAQRYEVACAADVEEAQALLRNEHFTIVLVDLRLSGRNGDSGGFDVIDFAREHSPNTRIVVLTASIGVDVEKRAYDLGADYFVVKPKPLGELAQILKEILAAS